MRHTVVVIRATDRAGDVRRMTLRIRRGAIARV